MAVPKSAASRQTHAYLDESHSRGHPAPAVASNSTKTIAGQIRRTLQFCREKISRKKRCNPQSHRIFDRSSLATATSPLNGSPQNLLTVQLDTKPPRSYASPQSSGILYAKSPSSRESSISITVGAPTKFPAPALRPHPLRHTCSRPPIRTPSPPSLHHATIPAVRQPPHPVPRPAQS